MRSCYYSYNNNIMTVFRIGSMDMNVSAPLVSLEIAAKSTSTTVSQIAAKMELLVP